MSGPADKDLTKTRVARDKTVVPSSSRKAPAWPTKEQTATAIESDEKADADDIWTEKPQDNNTPEDETEAPTTKSLATESSTITSPEQAAPSPAGSQPETPAQQIDPPAEPLPRERKR